MLFQQFDYSQPIDAPVNKNRLHNTGKYGHDGYGYLRQARAYNAKSQEKYLAPVLAWLSERAITMTVTHTGTALESFGDSKPMRRASYSVRFERAGRKPLEIPRYTASAVDTIHGFVPTAYDVLAAVQKSDVGTFADFCGDFGYDEDSRKAEQTYFAVQKEAAAVRAFFSAEELDQINEIAN